MRRALLAAGLAVWAVVAAPALGQDRSQSIADIKAELATLDDQVEQLRDELERTRADLHAEIELLRAELDGRG